MKLNVEMVPDSCWYSNLRSILPKEAWDYIRKDAYKRAEGKCMICGKNTTDLEAHEKWEYDEDNHVQKLVDVVAVCKDCHSVIHIGRTQLTGDIKRAEDHFMAVNNCSYAEYRKELGKANEEHQRRNKVNEWNLDLRFLQRYLDQLEQR